MKGIQVLVTGAGGFIGSHLAERLVEDGARVRALVHYNAQGRAGWLDHSPRRGDLEVVTGDLADRDSVRAAVAGVEVVFHLGALIAIPYSYQAPLSYVRTNLEGTLNVLQAVREAGVRRMVQTSTSEVYGTARQVPIREDHPLQGQSPYSASKIAADKMAEAFHAAYGVPVVTLRPFNTFGPRQSARAVIPTIMAQCLAGGPVRLGNLAPTRDLVFVADTVDGFIRAGSVPGIEGRTVHLGTGREIAIGDLAALIARIAGKPLDLETEARRLRPGPSEVERLLSDPALARTLLGWEARVSLEEGLERTLAWVAAHADLYRPGEYTV
jgi:dTDP-glucose 4,6-dehydratase